MYTLKVLHQLYFLIVILSFKAKLCKTEFQLQPKDKIVSTSETISRFVLFSCQYNGADIINWEVNGVTLSNSDRSRNFTASLFSLSYQPDKYIKQLKIPTNPLFNGTTVKCVASILDERHTEKTESALLTFQDNAVPLPTGFAQEPNPFGSLRELVLALGENATLFCQHCQTNDIEWVVDGTKIANSSILDGISLSVSAEGNCDLEYILDIDINIRNTTNISCKAVENRLTTHSTDPFTLLVQGPLAPVTHLTRQYGQENGTVLFTWERPFSLNVTRANPDIIYCIYIYSTDCTNSSLDLVAHDCNITAENYSSADRLNDNQLYQVEVKPKTNLKVARDETLFKTHKDRLVYFDDQSVRFKTNLQTDGVQVIVMIKLNNINSGVIPNQLSLELSHIESDAFICSALLNTSVTYMEEYVSNFTCTELIEKRRIYMGRLFVDFPVLACQVASTVEINTHLIRNIQVRSCQPGEVLVSAEFVNTSNTVLDNGFIAIIYTDSSFSLHYSIARRLPDELQAEVTISELPADEYRISVFSIQANGLPFGRSVSKAMNISITDHENVRVRNETDENSAITTVQATRQIDCINLTCTFNDSETQSSTNQCVAVISKKTDTTSKYGLLNIGIYNFTRIGITANGCLPEVNTSTHWIDILAYCDGLVCGTPKRINEILDDSELDFPTVYKQTGMITDPGHGSQTSVLGIILGVTIVPVLITAAIVTVIALCCNKKRIKEKLGKYKCHTCMVSRTK